MYVIESVGPIVIRVVQYFWKCNGLDYPLKVIVEWGRVVKYGP